MEVVPGDKFNIKATNLTRFAPLVTPIMHQASVYCHFFFVPNRILWPNWDFTSALPWTQRGPEATIPLGTTAPISYVTSGAPTVIKNLSGNTVNNATFDGAAALETTSTGILGANLPGLTYLDIDNADSLSADLSAATASSINDLRRAFRLQEWLERNARGGARYIEIITAHFGVRSSDVVLLLRDLFVSKEGQK